MTDSTKQLKAIRDQIDRLDRELLATLNRRAELALEAGSIKAGAGQRNDFYRPDREAEVRRALAAANDGPLADAEVVRLFQEIVSACRALETPMNIAFLGPAGTFTEAAVFKHFGRSVASSPLDTIDAVFREVAAGTSDYGVVPVENSTEGVVNHTLDVFIHSPLAICGEVETRIHHCLLGSEDGIDRVTRLYSHQQSLAQCRRWLDEKLPGVERIGVNSNAEAARRCADEPGAAAVAGEVAARTYGLEIIARNIEDEPNNTTRFLVIGAQSVPPSGMDKTSLILSAKNNPGALFELLRPFAERGLSMTRIESRPARSGVWEYVFFVDVEGHAEDPEVAQALDELARDAAYVKVLGSYPRAAE